jgi:hypothetical protein
MNWDEEGRLVHPGKAMAFRGLARELRQRCDMFVAGRLQGESFACSWYSADVTYLPDKRVRDDTGTEFAPGSP